MATVIALPKPEVLVSTQWVEEHRRDPKVRIVESDEDVLLYKPKKRDRSIRAFRDEDLNESA